MTLREEVDEFFESYNVMCELMGQKTVFIGENGNDIILNTAGFICYVSVTKKNIKLSIKVFSHLKEKNEICKKLDSYLKSKPPSNNFLSRVFKVEFKGSSIEQFKVFMRDYIFDILEGKR